MTTKFVLLDYSGASRFFLFKFQIFPDFFKNKKTPWQFQVHQVLQIGGSAVLQSKLFVKLIRNKIKRNFIYNEHILAFDESGSWNFTGNEFTWNDLILMFIIVH